MNFALRVAAFAFFLVCAVSTPAQMGHMDQMDHMSRPVQTFQTSAGAVKITPIYHASLLIEAGNKTIYLDPAKPADVTGLPPADLILITDIHGDHMDANLIAAVSKPGTEIMAPPAVVKTITSAMP